MSQGSLAKPVSNAARSNEYVLGTDAQEATVWGCSIACGGRTRIYFWEKTRIQPGMSVLDVGCGPGHATMDLAEIVGPTGQVIAIDESAGFLKQLNDMITARKMTHVQHRSR